MKNTALTAIHESLGANVLVLNIFFIQFHQQI